MIYLDNAATTPISDPVLKAMSPFLREGFGNASSAYELGKKSRDAIKEARKYIAQLINAEPEEIYFTSGGTEANNWAVKGTYLASRIGCSPNRYYFLSTAIEHPSVSSAVGSMYELYSTDGFDFDLIEPNEGGRVVSIGKWIPMANMVSVQFANNEIGTVQPIKMIGEKCQLYNVLFHTDAVQAFGQIPIDVKAMNIDMLSASGHKIHAPKGIGCLYIRNGVRISPLLHGGHQEQGRRAGTENVAAIVGFGEAAYQAKRTMKKRMKQITTMRDYMWQRIYKEIPNCFINGDLVNRLPGNISVTFRGIEGESLVLMMDKLGICISAGSACTTGSPTPSHVLKAIGLTDAEAHGTIRITLDEKLKLDEANYVIDSLEQCVERLRKC